jgi:hypothetical protein
VGVPTLTCEIAFGTDPGTTPVWTDVSDRHITSRIRRGRNHELDKVEAATSVTRLRDPDGAFDSTNLGSPYSPNVRPMRRMRVRATWEGVTYDRFNGYIESWPRSWTPGPAGVAYVEVHAVDAFKVLALANVNTTRSAEKSGTRVGAILDAIGWPAADRAIDTGLSTVQGVTLTDERALTHLQLVESTEGGILFVSRDGKVTFLDRTKPVTVALDAANLTWGDSGLEKDYVDLTTSFDDSQIWNDVKVTSPGHADGVASDATSQARYFKRTRVESTIHQDANEQQSKAEYLVARFSEPALRVTSLDLGSARGQNIQWPHVLGRELHDKVRARKTQVGGGTISQDSFVEGTTETIRQGAWDIVWNLSPLDRATDYWIWDTSRWDIDTRWYW